MRSQAPNPKPQTAQRFSEVDSLRAVACALVIISHSERDSGIIMRTLPVGYIGVLMFFAISGFVIPNSLRGSRWEGGKAFGIRRFWRLYPPFWITLILMYLVGTRDIGVMQWLSQSTMIPSYLGGVLLSPHFWTLQVELIFYIIVSVLFLFLGKVRGTVLFLAYLVCRVGAIFPSDLGTWLRVDCLMVMFWGALCREILHVDFSHRTWLAPVKGVNWGRAALLGILTGTLVFYPLGEIYFGLCEQDYSQIIDGLGLACAALGFLFWVILTPMRIDWLSRVGRWTYSTYLLHFGVIVMSHRVLNFFSIKDPNSVPLLFSSILIIASFAVGAVAYRWIEQPSDRIGKRLAARRSHRD